LFINERDAFLGLKHHQGMVRCLGDYGHKEIQQTLNSSETGGKDVCKDTYNILLEFGECDLDEYFTLILPPVFDIEIKAFWKALFEVADALDGIHNLETWVDGVHQYYDG
jgi:hypothetical protein